jgi:hypothetical protein
MIDSVTVISIVRLRALVRVLRSNDPTFDNALAVSLSAVEVNVGITTACLPALRPLLSAMLPTLFSPSTATQGPSTRQRYDEEQPKTFRSSTTGTVSRASRYRSSSNASYSRIESELEEMNSNHQANVAGTGVRVIGQARQVHIRSVSRDSSPNGISARLPRLPENTASFGAVDRRDWARHSRSVSSPLSGRRIASPRQPLVQKPLPITPFPVALDS